LFAYNGRLWNLPDSRLCDYTTSCKGCGENIPAPVQTMPDTWIIADCPLCGVKRRYMPADVSEASCRTGRLSGRPDREQVMGEMRRAIAREEQGRQKQDRFASTVAFRKKVAE